MEAIFGFVWELLECFPGFFCKMFFLSVAFVQEEGSSFGSFLRVGRYSHLSPEMLETT